MSAQTTVALRPRTAIVETLPPPATLYGRALRGLFKRGDAHAFPALRFVRPKALLDAQQIGRYARVCGFIPEHGVPTTFAHVMAFPLHLMLLTDPAFPWPAIGLVHISNSINARSRLQSGQALRIEVESGELVAHEKGQAFTLSTRIYRGGEAVWDAESTYLRRGIPGMGEPFESLPVVDTLARQSRWQLPAQLGRDYAKASGDFNPIHLHALSAKAFGFPRAIAHGMWTLGRSVAALQPSKVLNVAQIRGDFKAPIFLPADTTLWTVNPAQNAHDFEVRDIAGERLHLRGSLTWETS